MVQNDLAYFLKPDTYLPYTFQISTCIGPSNDAFPKHLSWLHVLTH